MAQQELPEYKRSQGIEAGTATPNYGDAMREVGAATNSLSAIGATVAQSASNALATQMGTQQGQTPSGDMLPPITDFDKTFVNSYNTQANATLSIQAQKLVSDAQIQVASANRITPDLISTTNKQLGTGLSRIAEQAPSAIKGTLQSQFASQLINMNGNLQEKMISQQRQDETDNLHASITAKTKNAYELSMNGNWDAAKATVEDIKKMAQSGYASRHLSQVEAQSAYESAQGAAINAHFVSEALDAKKKGKYEGWAKDFATKLPEGITNAQHASAMGAVERQVSLVDSLSRQDESLKAQQMLNQIAMNPTNITGTDWAAFEKSVSPLTAEKVQFKYIQAIKNQSSSTASTDMLIKNFGNAEAWANTNEKTQNDAFSQQVQYAVDNSHKTTIPMRSPIPISPEQAQVQVAAAAGGEVKLFTRILQDKLGSSNPASIESAAQQIHALQEMEAGHALKGLSTQDHAIYTQYEALRNSMDPTEAARLATHNVMNQDTSVQDEVNHQFQNYVSTKTQGGAKVTDFALKEVGLKPDSFSNPGMASTYGLDILNKYKAFYQATRGDLNSAKKMTAQYVNDNYGQTWINGGETTTLHPIEKVLGFKTSDGVPYIQQDLVDQLNERMVALKSAYDKGQSTEYWETVPLTGNKRGVFTTTYDPVQVKKHTRTASGEKVDTFNVVLQGNDFDNWDVGAQGSSGTFNLFLLAPHLGMTSYTPNVNSIHQKYNKDHAIKR